MPTNEQGTGPAADVSEHLRWLDALRAFAIIGVVAVHSFGDTPPGLLRSFCIHGGYGVQLFFLVSAFTLTKLYSKKLNRMGQLLDFAVRRVFRIWPMYFLGVLIYGGSYSWHDRILHALLLHGFSPFAFTRVVPGGWSIAVECQFYLIFPLMVIAFRRLGGALIFFGLAMLLASYSFYGWSDPLIAWLFNPSAEVAKALGEMSTIWLPRNIVFFAGGALLARLFDVGLLSGLDARAKKAVGDWGWITLAVICWITVPEMAPDPVVPFYRHALVCLYFMLFLAYMAIGQPRVFVNKFMCKLGTLSYSIYILHFSALRITHYVFDDALRMSTASAGRGIAIFAATMMISWGVAEITWRLVESPGIRLGRWVSRSLQPAETSI